MGKEMDGKCQDWAKAGKPGSDKEVIWDADPGGGGHFGHFVLCGLPWWDQKPTFHMDLPTFFLLGPSLTSRCHCKVKAAAWEGAMLIELQACFQHCCHWLSSSLPPYTSGGSGECNNLSPMHRHLLVVGFQEGQEKAGKWKVESPEAEGGTGGKGPWRCHHDGALS